MTGITPINPMIPGMGLVPPPPPTDVSVVKEIIHCKSCTLFPPNPSKWMKEYYFPEYIAWVFFNLIKLRFLNRV